jgi:hypothetical protein
MPNGEITRVIDNLKNHYVLGEIDTMDLVSGMRMCLSSSVQDLHYCEGSEIHVVAAHTTAPHCCALTIKEHF